MNTKLHRLSVSLAVFWVLTTTLHSEIPATASAGAKPIVGHNSRTEDVIKETTDIVVASFLKLGNPGPVASGALYYNGAEIGVLSVIMGHLTGNIEVRYSLVSVPGANREAVPVIGVDYIMFIEDRGGGEYKVRKLLPVTGSNIAAVRSFIKVAR